MKIFQFLPDRTEISCSEAINLNFQLNNWFKKFWLIGSLIYIRIGNDFLRSLITYHYISEKMTIGVTPKQCISYISLIYNEGVQADEIRNLWFCWHKISTRVTEFSFYHYQFKFSRKKFPKLYIFQKKVVPRHTYNSSWNLKPFLCLGYATDSFDRVLSYFLMASPRCFVQSINWALAYLHWISCFKCYKSNKCYIYLINANIFLYTLTFIWSRR